jgi:hypothetical protein
VHITLMAKEQFVLPLLFETWKQMGILEDSPYTSLATGSLQMCHVNS